VAVGREREEHGGLAALGGQAFLEDAGGQFLGHGEAGFALVLRAHRVRVVEEEHRVDVLARAPQARAEEWLGQRKGQQHEEQHAQEEEEEVLNSLPPRGALVRGLEKAQRGEEHLGGAPAVDHVDDDWDAARRRAQKVEPREETNQNSLFRLARYAKSMKS